MFNNELLFAQALNLQKPWIISKVEFSPELGELHIYIDFIKGSKFLCKECGKENLSVHDTIQKTWRHLDFFQHKAFIHCRTPRVSCDKDGVRMVDVPWAREGSGFTLLFEAFIIQLATVMPVNTVASKVKEHDTLLWRILEHYVSDARNNEDYSKVVNIGVDETSCKKGHEYITTFVDMNNSKVIYVTEGKDSSTLESFKQDFKEHNGEVKNVKNFSSDMSPAFIKGVKGNFPYAAITIDKFHLIKLLNEAVDEVRREEQKEQIILKNSRYVWLKNQENLKAKEEKKFNELTKLNLKTVRAYRIKLVFQDVFKSNDKNEAAIKLGDWYNWAIRSRLEPIKKFANTVKNHWQGICNYFDSGLTNGVLEGINSLIQAAKAKARGYKTTKNFKIMVYLIAGKLNMKISI